MSTQPLRRVCVFTGSSLGARPAYREVAGQLGRLLAERGLGLVYGGGHVGLMGAVSDAALVAGGKVIGVIPDALKARELAHARLTELRVVHSMHERKALMAELADAFIAMPGGFGTLEELFEIVTWAQLGLHAKPIGLLNVDGYYDGLLAAIRHAVAEGFIGPAHAALLLVADSPPAVLDLLLRAEPESVIPKWLDRDET